MVILINLQASNWLPGKLVSGDYYAHIPGIETFDTMR
jgi:hypothetical protein